MLLISILFLPPFPISSYDDEVDKVNQYQRLNLEDLEKIEIGKFQHTNQVIERGCQIIYATGLITSY